MFGYCMLSTTFARTVSPVRDPEWICAAWIRNGSGLPAVTWLPTAPPTPSTPGGNRGSALLTAPAPRGDLLAASLLPRAWPSELSASRPFSFLAPHCWWGDSLKVMCEKTVGGPCHSGLWPVGTAFWHSCFSPTCTLPQRRCYKEC